MQVNMDLSLLGLLWDPIKSFAGTCIAAGAAYAWYLLSPRKEEEMWIKKNGVTFYVYYRNVDWRCEKIRREVCADIPSEGSRDGEAVQHFNRELSKLKSDIECLERITELWADRVAGFPGWYPYKKLVNELIETSTFLSLSLRRHIDPIIWYVDSEKAGGPTALLQGDSRESIDLQKYLNYFRGDLERMWGESTKDSLIKPEGQAIAELQHNGKLQKRLGNVLAPLLKLLKLAEMEPEAIKDAMAVWKNQGEPCQVWFKPFPVPQESMPIASE